MTQPNPFAPQQPAAGGNPFGQQAPPQQPPPQQQAPPQQPPPQQPAGQNPFAGGRGQQQASAPDDDFDQPGSGGGDRISAEVWRSYVGSLVLFEVKSWKLGVTTANGIADAAVANVHVIDINGGPLYHENAMVFTPAIRDALEEAASRGGGSVLGRITLVQSKQGNRDYPGLDPHTDVDKATARQYLAWRASQGVQQPAAPAQQDRPPY
jgi:hypothetical protein